MLKVQEIREIIKLIDESSIREFTYETNGSTIIMKKSNDHPDGTGVGNPAAEQQIVTATNPGLEKTKVDKENIQVAEAVPVKKESVADSIDTYQITSPMVGTFYRASSPERDPYVKTGSMIDESSIVCIVEAMKLFNEIEAEIAGEVVDVLVEDGELVEYGQPLFKVKKK